MWAQCLVAPGRFERIEVPDLSADDVPDGHVLLRTLAGGICGSDLPAFRGALFPHPKDQGGHAGRVPGLPMHEVVGEVLVSRHPGHAPGDTVVGWASGFDAIAECVVSDGEMLIATDPALAPATAITIQPLACVLYAVEQIPGIAGIRAAVLGQGPIGLLFSHVLNQRGARVTGVDRVDRGGQAKAFGICETVTSNVDRWAATLTDEDRPQLIVEAIGHQVATLRTCFEAAAFGGQVFYFGVPDDLVYPMEMRTFFRKNLTLRAGWTMDRRRVLREAASYLAAHDGLRDAYVTHVLAAGDVQRAFEAAAAPTSGQVKIVLDMTAS
jgi:threonine dehydrogenase-like Zn-dependent dehydrogenase